MTNSERFRQAALAAEGQPRLDALHLADKLDSLARSATEALRLGNHAEALGFIEALSSARIGLAVYLADQVRKEA